MQEQLVTDRVSAIYHQARDVGITIGTRTRIDAVRRTGWYIHTQNGCTVFVGDTRPRMNVGEAVDIVLRW